MSYQTVLYDVADGIATVTLNRPDKLNAWTRQMQGEVKDAMLQAASDEAVRAIILTGAGRGFCAGADMEVLTAASSGGAVNGATPRPAVDPTASVNARADFRMTHSYFPAIAKPIVAAVNGPCAGLGFVIALYCDMRFAGESAMFTTSFAQRGLIAEHGLSWLLPKLVGLPHAADLLYSARKVRAPEALQLGLVQRLFPDHDLMAQTRAYLKTIVEDVSPRSVAIMKRQIWDAQFQTLSEATVITNHDMEQSFSTADFKEGVAHFLEKRKARFTGR